jgi:2-polyprenyl-6-methoxyphenol hydroxylase-like FAD-dependent oxidoreductase
MEILNQLGLLERFLKRPHSEIRSAELEIAGRSWTIGDLSHLHTPAPFIAFMPQWDFLDFLRDEAQAFPGFSLEMEAPVDSFIQKEDQILGVQLRDGKGLRAPLTIAADGRDSLVRQKHMLPLKVLGAPMDVFWFRIAKKTGGDKLRGSFERGRLLVLLDRGDYWQCALVIPKGAAEQLRRQGIGPIRDAVHAAAPDVDLSELDDVDDLKLLSVALDRLTRWYRPGLLAIGDAAHAMSPIGGVGINLAIQDAVAAANALAGPLARGDDVDPLLHKVQDRRMFPTRVIQAGQKLAQDNVIGRLLEPGEPIRKAPLAIRLLDRFPILRRIPGRLIGLGVRREKVESPAQPPPGG